MTSQPLDQQIFELAEAFDARLREKVVGESRLDVARALELLAARYRGEEGVGRGAAADTPASAWVNGIVRQVEEALSPLSVERSKGRWRVHLRATSAEEEESILEQCIEVGALLVAFDEAPPLNAEMALQIELPICRLSVQTRGRVVNTSAVGTAVEVSALGREDRVAMEVLLDDYRVDLPGGAGEGHGSAGEDDSSVEFDGLQAMSGDLQVASGGGGHGFRRSRHRSRRHSFSSVRRGGTSVALGALASARRREGAALRRQVELTDPDRRVITSTYRALNREASSVEIFGPENPWLTPKAEPERVEELVDERILDILLQLSEDGFDGVLEAEILGGDHQVYFDGGLVVHFVSRPRRAAQELGPVLQQAGLISEEQLAMAAADAEERGEPLSRSLLDLGLLDHDRIRHAIAGRLTYLIQHLSESTSGVIRLWGAEGIEAGFLPAPPLRVHVPVERVVFQRLVASLRAKSAEEREEFIGEHLDAYPEVASSERDRLERTVLEAPHEQFLRQLVSGRRRLREVFTESPLGSAETFAVVFGLHRIGVIRFDTSLHQTVVRERYRENVTVKYLSVHKASYFEVLNVHWSSYDEVIERAYRALKSRFDPAAVPDHLEDEVRQRVEEIADRIETAYEVLASREDRHAYRKRVMPDYKLQHAVPLFLKQAELAQRRGQLDDASDALRRLLEIEPDHEQAKRRIERLEAER